MTPPSRVPLRIRALRRQRKLSQADLAKRTGLTREYLSRLEAGRHDPRLSVLERIAKGLRVSVATLVK